LQPSPAFTKYKPHRTYHLHLRKAQLNPCLALPLSSPRCHLESNPWSSSPKLLPQILLCHHHTSSPNIKITTTNRAYLQPQTINSNPFSTVTISITMASNPKHSHPQTQSPIHPSHQTTGLSFLPPLQFQFTIEPQQQHQFQTRNHDFTSNPIPAHALRPRSPRHRHLSKQLLQPSSCDAVLVSSNRCCCKKNKRKMEERQRREEEIIRRLT
jgi:hypothetical protein